MRPDTSDRRRWDDKHRFASDAGAGRPSSFLETSLPHLPRGLALDIACGRGANALLLAANGFDVEALDWSVVALRRLLWESERRGLRLGAVACDVTRYPLPSHRYAVVVCTRFLERSIWPALTNALRPGGGLIIETFTLRHLERNPDFPRRYCLGEGELLRGFGSTLRVARYRELPDETEASLLAFRESTEDPPEAAPDS